MKTNIDYYPRKKNWSKHPKIKMLKIKYGEAGDSKFGTLCDYIADAKYCWLDLSEPYIKTDVADALKFNFEELDEFVSFLENECKLIIRDENKISTNVAQEALSMVMKDRESAKSRRNKPRQSTEQLEKSPEQIKESADVLPIETTNKTKLNKIKVNESKVNESKELPDGPHESEIIDVDKNLKKEKDSGQKEKSVYTEFIKIYGDFIKQKTNCPAKIDGSQGNAAKSLIEYLKKISNSGDDEGALDSWKRILSEWDKLDQFSQNKLKLTDINSNIVNLISQIKNGKKNRADNNTKNLKSTIHIGNGGKMGKL